MLISACGTEDYTTVWCGLYDGSGSLVSKGAKAVFSPISVREGTIASLDGINRSCRR